MLSRSIAAMPSDDKLNIGLYCIEILAPIVAGSVGHYSFDHIHRHVEIPRRLCKIFAINYNIRQ